MAEQEIMLNLALGERECVYCFEFDLKNDSSGVIDVHIGLDPCNYQSSIRFLQPHHPPIDNLFYLFNKHLYCKL